MYIEPPGQNIKHIMFHRSQTNSLKTLRLTVRLQVGTCSSCCLRRGNLRQNS